MKEAKPHHNGHDPHQGQSSQSNFLQRKKQPEQEEEVLPFVSAKRIGVQPKLTIGAPNDPYEQEADRMADFVMRKPMLGVNSPGISRLNSGALQRQCTSCEHDDEGVVQRKCSTCEAKEKGMIQRQEMGGTGQASTQFSNRLQSRRGQGSALSPDVQQQMGGHFNTDFSQVRVHTDSEANSMSQEIHAQAFTHGSDIYFNQGKYNPESTSGERLLAHELTHVVQQTENWISPIQTIPDIQLFREVNDRNVFQGDDRSIDSRVTLDMLMRLFVLENGELSLSVQSTRGGQQTVRFTSDWINSTEGTAVLMGRIRYEIALRVANNNANIVTTTIGRLTGNNDRIEELRDYLVVAQEREADQSILNAEESAPYLVEEASGTGEGANWECRGYRADRTAGSRRVLPNPSEQQCFHILDPRIREALRGRSDTRARRALAERLPDARRRIRDGSLVLNLRPGRTRPRTRPRSHFSRLHAGLDISGRLNTGIYSPIAGIVFSTHQNISGYGKVVRIYHPSAPSTNSGPSNRGIGNGSIAPVITSYAHLNRILVEQGQQVFPGQAIGLMGHTGTSGNHLHFSVQKYSATSRRRLTSRMEVSEGIRARNWFINVTGGANIGNDRLDSGRTFVNNNSSTPSVRPKMIQRIPNRLEQRISNRMSARPLSYVDSTEMIECNRILGQGSEEFCRDQVLGAPEPLQNPPIPSSLNINNATRINTAQGDFLRFPNGSHHSNNSKRPRFSTPQSELVIYTGTGNNGSDRIHSAVYTSLNRMLFAMHSEGNRINDESLKRARVDSAYRPPTVSEGNLYLAALRRTINRNPAIFGTLTFPSNLTNMARSELGFYGSSAHIAFQTALAGSGNGWNLNLARQLLRITSSYKAPRGGSTHHSGVVVDINFPYAINSNTVRIHNMDRDRNADAFRSAAGVWLRDFALRFGFDTYNTRKEIWHQEWRNWEGSQADPNL